MKNRARIKIELVVKGRLEAKVSLPKTPTPRVSNYVAKVLT